MDQHISQQTALHRLRRVALATQGLTQSSPFGRGPGGSLRAITHLGYVQIDTISVVERAHHHVIRTRVPNYQVGTLNKLLNKGEVFEYWSHAAAFLPMQDYRYSLPYKQAIRDGKKHWWRSPDKKLMGELLERIRHDGPLRSRDLEAPSTHKTTGWWEWKPAKRALEQLYMQGDLMVKSRDGFQKTYDLTENVIPPEVDTRRPTVEEYATHLLDQQLRCHGFVTLKGATYLRRDAELRAAMKRLTQERLASTELQAFKLGNGASFLAPPDLFDRRLPPGSKRLQILSPFDNSVIQRERVQAIFGFEYQIECYVPEAKRKYGYFSLPLLYRDHFVGRMDCKAHRKTATLAIKSLHFEIHPYSEEEVLIALAAALPDFLSFQGCLSVNVERDLPTHIKRSLGAI